MPYNSKGMAIINNRVRADRVLNTFPQAQHPDLSPYKRTAFHATVRAACAENRACAIGLRICKGVIVGDAAVGKTSLVNRFCHNAFDRDYKTTIGVDFEVEKFLVLSVPFTLQIWDTAGQERFKSIAASYYRGANGIYISVVIVMFDMSDLGSLEHCHDWMNEATKNSSDPIKFLVGTKSDLLTGDASRDIENKGLKIAKEMQAEFWSVSSKSDENVNDLFYRVVALTFNNMLLKDIDPAQTNAVHSIGQTIVGPNKENLYETDRRMNKCC